MSPLVAWLAHEDCPVTGHVYSAGGGRIARYFVGLTPGYLNKELTIEDVRDHMDEIDDAEGYQILGEATEELRLLARALR